MRSIPIYLLLTATLFTSSAQNPQRGSIDFGTESPPIEWEGEDLTPYRNSFIKVAQNVVPSVVAVIPASTEQQPPVPPDQEQIQGLGSGITVSRQGHILTNAHVVQEAESVEIRLADGRFLEAEIIGTDSLTDVAVLKIAGEAPSDLPVAYLGDSDDLLPGDWVAAIGSPFGLTSTITSGIVSALERRVGLELAYQNFIQTDAAINPGNSGGPLVNLDGAVMGINTVIFSPTGGFIGIGLAIPINLARKVMEDLVYEGRVIRGYIGVGVRDLTPQLRREMGVDIIGGAVLTRVLEGQPAVNAGLRRGDIVVSVGGHKVENANDLNNIVASLDPGSRVEVIFIRNNERMETTIEITERP
ncbi:MAG: S1C family serine protease [Chitinispirillaceae bacterium]